MKSISRDKSQSGSLAKAFVAWLSFVAVFCATKFGFGTPKRMTVKNQIPSAKVRNHVSMLFYVTSFFLRKDLKL